MKGEVEIMMRGEQMSAQTKEKGCNGWSNWETWHTALVADNHIGLSNAARAMARACLKFEAKGKFDWTRAEAGFKRTLATAWAETKQFRLQNHRDYGEGWTLTGKVNWREVAEHFMDAEREEAAYQAAKGA